MGAMTIVYDLWFKRRYPDREVTDLHISIYATEADAAEAIDCLRDQSGFRDSLKGFNTYPVRLEMTGWREGFVTEFMPEKELDANDRPA